MSIFICPVCRGLLGESDKSLICENGHVFDKAKEGYVYLLPPGKKNSKSPGDSREMLMSRRRFLERGHYSKLADALCSACRNAARTSPCGAFADLGCGEGYYTEKVAAALLRERNINAFVGIDISKEAVRLASKRRGTVRYAAASVYSAPVADGSVSLALNVFAPLAEDEIRRIVMPNGYFVYVVPSPRHLWEIKCTVYEKPYENPVSDAVYAGYTREDVIRLRYESVMDKEDIMTCFGMTPYFWRSPKEGVERLSALDGLRCSIGFDVHIFKREN